MNALWVLSRATGLVSLVLLTLVVVLGVVVRRRGRVTGLPRFAVVGLHRNAALLAVLLLGAHVATVVADSYVSIGWRDAVVPFLGSYHPFWLGLGTLAVDLLLAVVLTSLARHRLPVRLWRGIHLTAYAAWPVALVHSVGLGTDMRSAPGLGVAAACFAAAALAVLWRVSAQPGPPPEHRAAHQLQWLRHEQSRRSRTRAPAGRAL